MAKRTKIWKDDEGEWPGYNDHRRHDPAKWKLKRSWKLQRCKLTENLILPSTKAWCKTYYHHNGGAAFSDWVTVEAYTFEKLKGTGRLDSVL